jgi:hypothetical protein
MFSGSFFFFVGTVLELFTSNSRKGHVPSLIDLGPGGFALVLFLNTFSSL